MQNPWVALPEGAFVMSDDRPYVEAWNEWCRGAGKEDYLLHTEVQPEPFVGPRGAPVLLLGLNPGFGPEEGEAGARAQFKAAVRANFANDDPSGHIHPGLLDQFANAGGEWWRRCWRAVDREGVPFERIARRLLSVEFHGYFSRKWASLPVTLPSQRYGFHLVSQAMERQAFIIVARGGRDWNVAVPGLMRYPRRASTITQRSTFVSRGNLQPSDAFEAIVDALGS